MTYQLLAATMNQNDHSLCERMNLHSDAVIVNQCDRFGAEEWTHNGHAVRMLSFGERGVGLSGGQRQRIALARALAVKPSILIMDDTTSAVDMETEQYIQQQLRELPFPCTKFIIAQRISSMRDADLILVLKDGRIAERGTHEELVRLHGYYYQTYALQNDLPTEEVG